MASKTKVSDTEDSADHGFTTPATPTPSTVASTTIDGATTRSASRKHSREDVPTNKRSSSATVASASKAVTKPGNMGPPQTPARSSTKSRLPMSSTPKTHSPDPAAISKPSEKQNVDADQQLQEGSLSEPHHVAESPSALETHDNRMHEQDDREDSPPKTQIVQPVAARLEGGDLISDQDWPDPEVPIEDFDWEDLDQRHHERLQEFEVKEHEVFDELQRLNMMLSAWAGAGQAKESERATKRLRTRMSYVQQREVELSQRRQHYLHVVNAFQSALNLLEDT
ncbi:hypothetical protein AMS68_001357 [Peltaster fructicola]|uniref:Uncharacterized protein n=1 Tax=Peltaster fructicola TaxID=286661 RepID=A0A6H0XMW9_9PEZI|nr:hypothetical protein AMS68_001357 [Peltaster fructicola]